MWRFLLTGGVALENPYPNPAPEWLSDKSWSEIVRISDIPSLNQFKTRECFLIIITYIVYYTGITWILIFYTVFIKKKIIIVFSLSK